MTPIPVVRENAVPVNASVLMFKTFSMGQNTNLLMSDNPGRVRSQITNVVF